MPRFRYKVVNSNGELLEGETQAGTQEAVIERLKELGHTPIRVDEFEATQQGFRRMWSRRHVAQKEVGRFTRDLVTLLRAGVPLERSLEMLAELSEERETTELLNRLLEDVRGGAALSDAMEAQHGVFNPFYVNMVRAAEAGGALEAVLGRLAEFIEQYNTLKSNVKTALIYPGILITITVLSLIVLMTYVVPQFSALFEEMGQELPLMTRIVIGTGEALQASWWIIVALLIAAWFYLRYLLARPAFRKQWDRWVLGLPLAGDLIVKIEVSVFARTLGTLLASGVPLLTALAIVKDTLTNHELREALGLVSESARRGQGLAGPIMQTGRFPKLAAHLIRVGEESGNLDTTLSRLAEIYDAEVRTTIQRILSLLEPVLIIGLGFIIGGIIMSILVAILSVNELAF
ncbi:MAG: type II secretion system F family protein [Granulosicoccaceae bacterium]|jgi:general secretion pathway protein F